TGHISLNAYLHRFGTAPSPLCSNCLVLQTLSHYLLSCPMYCCQRLQLIVRLRTARLNFKCLLAAKSDHKPVLTYVRDTLRLPRYSL
ncbi:hypothetical protein C8R45DRAFT_829743, partial [Mycena sanguinolenta]